MQESVKTLLLTSRNLALYNCDEIRFRFNQYQLNGKGVRFF